MQIKIEIDVRPEELRRFVGLPDVAGLQDDVIQFVREKLNQAGDSFDAGAFVKNNLKLLSRSSLLGKFFSAAKPKAGDDDEASEAESAEAGNDTGMAAKPDEPAMPAETVAADSEPAEPKRKRRAAAQRGKGKRARKRKALAS